MGQKHKVVTKVWIEPGCIVCDACENNCPEVFDVKEGGCSVRGEMQDPGMLGPLTPMILDAAEECPVEVIRVETKVMEGVPPWEAVDMGQEISRRGFSLALAVGWGALAVSGVVSVGMLGDFLAPKVVVEPRKVFRVGKAGDFSQAGVYEQFKHEGIWLVNLQPEENRLTALSTVCTHLGCIPVWLSAEAKFRCPCHGSGYFRNGVNFEGPAPRPLERFAIWKEADGTIVVDKSRVFRQELGQWENPESFVVIG